MKTNNAPREIKRSDWQLIDPSIGLYQLKTDKMFMRSGPIPTGERFDREMGNHCNLHPRIKLDMRRLVMKVRDGYEIDLEAMDSSAEVLDFIFQVAGKTWSDTKLIGEMIHAIEDACQRQFGDSAQGVLCPWGNSMRIDWKNRTSKRAKPTPTTDP